MAKKKKKKKKLSKKKITKKKKINGQRKSNAARSDLMNREGLTWLEWLRAATFNLSAREKKTRVIPYAEMRKDWKAGVDPTGWAASWQAGVPTTVEEEKGIIAIISLQGLVKIKESEEDALAGWRAMTAKQQQQTLSLYKELFGKKP